MPTCAQCATENPDIAKFCLACGAPITVAEKHEEERKPVTAVFVDIVGSTSRAEELDPEEVLRLLEPYYRELRGELERHGGTVEKFVGDAVVAVFGAPIAHGDDAERAVRAALAARDALEELNAAEPELNLQARLVVNTGEAIVTIGARPGRGEAMVAGDVVNTAEPAAVRGAGERHPGRRGNLREHPRGDRLPAGGGRRGQGQGRSPPGLDRGRAARA